MNYELERALRDKVEMWQFHALQSEVQRLQHANQELERRLSNVEGTLSRQIVSQLIDTLIQSGVFPDDNALYTLKNYI